MSGSEAIALHEKFCALTKTRLTLRPHWLLVWKRFIAQGFTAQDLEIVVRWIHKQIHSNRGGYSELSFQLRVFSANDWSNFEERLQLAQKTFRARPQPTQAEQTREIAVSETEKITVLDPQKTAPERTPEMKAQVAEVMRDFRKKMKGNRE